MDRREFLHQVVGAGFVVTTFAGLLPTSSLIAAPTASSKVKWLTSLKAAQKLAIQQDKPMLIVFGATWCPPCRKLESETLVDKRTVEMIERDFIPVHLDFDKETKIVKVLEIERLPSIVILSPEADLLHKSEGFTAPKEFQTKLTSALGKRTDVHQVRATASGR